MLYQSDADIVYPINLVDVRAFLSISADSQEIDSFLTDAIHMICARVESLMPFWVSERGISLSVPAQPSVQVKGEIQRVVRVISYDLDGNETDITDRCGILSTPNGSVIYPPAVDGPTKLSVVFVPTAYVPDAVRMAILTGIRNLYQDRTKDPITEEVTTILAPFTEANI